tara:strand:- start:854 stop:1201 length:348 start_codon:yes stop_codon:yes gene_type:complete
MKNRILILMLIGFMVSCSNNNDTNESFEINGRFTHLINDCDNGGDSEINCIEFINDSTVDVLIGGGDIVFRTNYQINDDKIIFEQTGGLNFDISFNIQNETTINRIEDNEVWEKE